MTDEFGFNDKDRYHGAKLRRAAHLAEARAVDRSKEYRERHGMLKKQPPKKKRIKRNGHHGWRS